MKNRFKILWLPLVVFFVSLLVSCLTINRIERNSTEKNIERALQTADVKLNRIDTSLNDVKTRGEMDVAYMKKNPENVEDSFAFSTNYLLDNIPFVKYIALYGEDYKQIYVNNDHTISCDSSIMSPKYFDFELALLNNHPEIQQSNGNSVIFSNVHTHAGSQFFYILYRFKMPVTTSTIVDGVSVTNTESKYFYYVVEFSFNDFLKHCEINSLTKIYDYQVEIRTVSDSTESVVYSNVKNYNSKFVSTVHTYKGIQSICLYLYSENGFLYSEYSTSAVIISSLLIILLTSFSIYISYLINKNDEYKAESRLDLLTHIPNEKAELNRLITLEKNKKDYTLFYLDIDNFKMVNDIYGHDIGDEVLQKIARLLTLAIDNNSLASRIHGDEFSVIKEGRLTEEEAYKEARRIEDSLASTLYIEGKHINVRVSCGYAIVPLHTTKYEEAIRIADKNMYVIKNKHKKEK